MTIEESYKSFVEQLQIIYDEREADNIADWVFEYEGLSRLERITNKRKQINHLTNKQVNAKLAQLLQHKPVQYVLQEAWFYKVKFFVNEHVLIPRPETEELVEWIVQGVRGTRYDVQNKKTANIQHPTSDILHILDIGTGSGCIAISVKKELSDAEVFAIDISEDALSVAKKNAAEHNAAINFKQLDFLNESLWSALSSFNIIVSNPPYIPSEEKVKLNRNVVEHEPHLALFVDDNAPFIFYNKIALFATEHLKEEGKIFVEVHEDYSKEVSKIFLQHNFKTEKRKDIFGRERMIKAYK